MLPFICRDGGTGDGGNGDADYDGDDDAKKENVCKNMMHLHFGPDKHSKAETEVF